MTFFNTLPPTVIERLRRTRKQTAGHEATAQLPDAKQKDRHHPTVNFPGTIWHHAKLNPRQRCLALESRACCLIPKSPDASSHVRACCSRLLGAPVTPRTNPTTRPRRASWAGITRGPHGSSWMGTVGSITPDTDLYRTTHHSKYWPLPLAAAGSPLASPVY